MKNNQTVVIAALAFAFWVSAGSSVAQEMDLPALRGTLAIPVVQEPDSAALDRSKGQQWHRLTMRITGSMCPACLMELEGKIKQMPGVSFAKIDRAASTPKVASDVGAAPAPSEKTDTDKPDVGAAPAPPEKTEAEKPDASSAAPPEKEPHKHTGTPRSVGTVIVFDAKEMSADALIQLIKRELYKPMDVKETEK